MEPGRVPPGPRLVGWHRSGLIVRFFEAAPEGTDLNAIRSHLATNEHVIDVHDLHAWTVTSNLPALSAHVVIDDGCFHDGHAPGLLDEMQACLVGHFDVEHSTFQLEPAGHAEHEHDAHA